MVWVAYALLALSKTDEPESVRAAAWLHYVSICAQDMCFEELLTQPGVAAWALVAIDNFEPPEGDVADESVCEDIEMRLREALDVRVRFTRGTV